MNVKLLTCGCEELLADGDRIVVAARNADLLVLQIGVPLVVVVVADVDILREAEVLASFLWS